MEQQEQLAAPRMMESLVGWWELAGVDAAVGALPVNWLESEAKPEIAENARATFQVLVEANPTPLKNPTVNWPSDIETLRTMIASGAQLPGNTFGSTHITPVGPTACEVMIISDLPDQDEILGSKLGCGATGALLSRMLSAIGIEISDCYWTALATTIPSTGEVPENAYTELADFARHQIGLVRPKSVVLLGSAACKALLDEELMKARAELRNINHDGSNMAVLTTFHPRTLIARPAMKAQAWRDLQMFAKRAGM